MRDWFKGLFIPKPAYRPVSPPQPRRVVITAACASALRPCLEPYIRCQHEGVVYLIGQTDGFASCLMAAFRPVARTTRGSFHVEAKAMRLVVEGANAYGLAVVGQLHTHPGEAFHSDGDIEGALIRFPGFVSIVLPDYGTRLPGFDEAAIYMFDKNERRFVELNLSDLSILPETFP